MSSPDLLLVRPPESGLSGRLVVPPIGMLYVAAAVRQAGWRVAVLDCAAEGLNEAAMLDRVRALRPEVIGLSGMTPMLGSMQRAALLLRPLCSRMVVGGVHATRFRERALEQLPQVDALVIGEGEEVAPALLSWWSLGGAGAPPAGVLVRGAAFAEAPLPDVHSLPVPARDLVPNERYRYLFQTRPRITTLITSRGCPFGCTFCDKTISGSRWRARRAEAVVDEMEHLERDLGLGYAVIFDDNFTLSAKRVERICREILRRGLRLQWKCEARVDGLDPALARLMQRAGCRTVAFGVESGNQSSLETLGKGASIRDAERALRAARSAGLETVAYVLIGIPGEGPEEALETLRFCQREQVDFVQFSTLSPFPGTALYEQARANGWYQMTSVTNPADAEEQRATLLPPGWSEQSLGRTLRQVYGRFYLRPRYLARQLGRAARNGSLPIRAGLGLSVGGWLLKGSVGLS